MGTEWGDNKPLGPKTTLALIVVCLVLFALYHLGVIK